MLDLLNRKGADIPQAEKKKMEKEITNLITGMRASMLGGRTTMDHMPEADLQRAKLIHATTFMSDLQDTDRGIRMAKEYLAQDPNDETAHGYKTGDTRDFEMDE